MNMSSQSNEKKISIKREAFTWCPQCTVMSRKGKCRQADFEPQLTISSSNPDLGEVKGGSVQTIR
jgi:hypothetical protein